MFQYLWPAVLAGFGVAIVELVIESATILQGSGIFERLIRWWLTGLGAVGMLTTGDYINSAKIGPGIF